MASKKKRIIITVDEDGKLSFRTEGYIGSACMALRAVEESFGSVQAMEYTDEYNEKPTTQKVIA